MESDLTESALFIKLWTFADKNRKLLLYGIIVLAVVGAIIAFYMVHANEKQNEANNELSKLTARVVAPNGAEATPESLLKISADYPGTAAAQRASLLAAADLFTAGKYDAALTQFQKFVQDYNSSPLVAQAALGVASCNDAMGKTNEAVSDYKGIVDKYSQQNVAPQARLALARLLEAQGQFKEARGHLEELARSYPGTVSSQAAARLQELLAAHPELNAPVNPPLGMSVPGLTNSSSRSVTLSPTSSTPTINIPAPK